MNLPDDQPWSNASAPIWGLVCHFAGKERRQRPLLMLKAYLDDSGNDGESPVFVVAGFVASAEKWAKFSDEWQQALDMKPRLDYFRMTEAFERAWDPITQDWRDAEFTEKMRLLFRIIETHAAAAISVSMSWSGFRKARKIFGISEASPYPIAFSRIIYDLGQAREELGLNGKIDFIFDRQSDRKAIRLWWPQLYEAFNMQTVLSDVVGVVCPLRSGPP